MGAARSPGPLRPAGVVGATCGRPLARVSTNPWGATTSARHPPAGMPPGRAAFLKVASLDFYRKRPRRLRRGGRTAFAVKSGGKTTRGPWRRWAVRAGQKPTAHCRPSSMQVSDHSLRRKRQSSLLPLHLLSPPNPLRWASAGAPCSLTSQALPRLGWHASGLPCKPWELLRCTRCARRAAIGTMPLKYLGGHRIRPPNGAPAEAQRSGFGGERRPSGGNELSRLRGSERSAAWADDVGRDDPARRLPCFGLPSGMRVCPEGNALQIGPML